MIHTESASLVSKLVVVLSHSPSADASSSSRLRAGRTPSLLPSIPRGKVEQDNRKGPSTIRSLRRSRGPQVVPCDGSPNGRHATIRRVCLTFPLPERRSIFSNALKLLDHDRSHGHIHRSGLDAAHHSRPPARARPRYSPHPLPLASNPFLLLHATSTASSITRTGTDTS